MHRSSSSNFQSRGSYQSNGNSNFKSYDRRSDRENNFSFQKKNDGFSNMKAIPRPNWSQLDMKQFEKIFFNQNKNQKPLAEVQNFMNTNSITVSGGEQILPILNFSDLDIPREVLNKIQDQKYDRPTPIQSMCWPSLLNGHDMVGIAQTGSGKTFGFVLPMIIHIMNNQRYVKSFGRDDAPGPIGLVVAPTRELAMQIQQVAEEFGNQLGIRNVVIYGGSSKHAQLSSIRRGAEIYIATPGRLIDFVKEGQISLQRCTFLVLDEADRMLDMGFEPQIRKIIEQIRPDRQTAMFSATWPKEVRKLAEDFISNYVHINIGSGELTANPNIEQIIEVCQEHEKESKLRNVLSQIMNQRDSKAIVFVETKRKVDMYSKFMQSLGFHCLAIHGDKKQQEREWVLNEFKRKPKSILCATDVAARGLNISDIKYVINIDYPMQGEDYIHRIGRTARNSNKGTAFTFITSENSKHVPKLIEILRDVNQPVSDSLLALVRNTGYGNRNGPNRFQRPNNGYSNGSNQAYKRPAAALDSSDYGRNDSNDEPKRVKRNRWDEGNETKQENGYQNGNGNYNGYQNKYQNGNSYPKPSSTPLMQSGQTYSPTSLPASLPLPPQVNHMAAPAHIPTPLLAGPQGAYSSYANYF